MAIVCEVTFEGDPVKPWTPMPNDAVVERIEWMTNILTAYDGEEQRIQLRAYPRQFFEYANLVSDRERRQCENTIFGWQTHPFVFPIWMDSETLSADIDATDTVIPCVTANRGYTAGGFVMLITSPTTVEVVEVLTVNPTNVVTASPIDGDWLAGVTTVAPMRVGRMPDQVSGERFTGADLVTRSTFRCIDTIAYTPATETMYRSYPVMLIKTNWTEDPRQDFQRKAQTIDAGTGGIFIDDEADGPILTQSHRWLLNGRDEIQAFRQWLWARKGRLTAFWMPTFSQDLVVVADIDAADTTIDVQHSGYTDNVDQALGRRDIRVELYSGTVYYRRITDSEVVDDDIERLTINSALGADIDADQVALVSFMYPARLAADSAEIAWWTWEIAEAALSIRGLRDDL